MTRVCCMASRCRSSRVGVPAANGYHRRDGVFKYQLLLVVSLEHE